MSGVFSEVHEAGGAEVACWLALAHTLRHSTLDTCSGEVDVWRRPGVRQGEPGFDANVSRVRSVFPAFFYFPMAMFAASLVCVAMLLKYYYSDF